MSHDNSNLLTDAIDIYHNSLTTFFEYQVSLIAFLTRQTSLNISIIEQFIDYLRQFSGSKIRGFPPHFALFGQSMTDLSRKRNLRPAPHSVNFWRLKAGDWSKAASV